MIGDSDQYGDHFCRAATPHIHSGLRVRLLFLDCAVEHWHLNGLLAQPDHHQTVAGSLTPNRVLTFLRRQPQTAVPVVLYGSQFWDEVMDFEALSRWGVISAEDLTLFHRADTPQAAFDYLQQRLEPLVAAKRR